MLLKKSNLLAVENEKCMKGKPLVKKIRIRGENGVFID